MGNYLRISKFLITVVLTLVLMGCENGITGPGASDGNVICYVKSYKGHGEIFTNNIIGSNPQDISNYSDDDEYPQWSPDGRYIVYSRSIPVNGPLVIVYDTKTQSSTDLTSDGGGASLTPQWTPNGKVCFGYPYSGAKYHGTYIMNPDGSDKKKILDSTPGIYFYQDSYTFLYIEDTKVYKTNVDNTFNQFMLDLQCAPNEYITIRDFNPLTGEFLVNTNTIPGLWEAIATYSAETKQLNPLLAAEGSYALANQRYSKDYSKILFTEIDTTTYVEQYLSVLDNGKKRRLVRTTGSIVEGEWLDYNPMQFSPDDRCIAFSKNVSLGGAWVGWVSSLYVIDFTTGDVQFIDKGSCPSWNPRP